MDREVHKTKVLDLKKLYNFIVDNFFIWNYLSNKNYIWSLKFSNELGWRNDQNKTCRFQKVIQFCSWQLFHLKSSIQGKLWVNFLTFEIQILQMTSGGEMGKTKVVDLKKLQNFVVDNFFIWINLCP